MCIHLSLQTHFLHSNLRRATSLTSDVCKTHGTRCRITPLTTRSVKFGNPRRCRRRPLVV